MYEPLRHIRKSVRDDDYSPEHPYAELPGKHYVGSSDRSWNDLHSVPGASANWYYDIQVGPKVDIWNRHIKVRRYSLKYIEEYKLQKYLRLDPPTDLHLTTRQWLKKRCPHIDFGPEPDVDQAATERYRARGTQGSPRKVEGEGISAKVSCDNTTAAESKGSVEAPADVRIMPERTTYMTSECTVAGTSAPGAARDGREGGAVEAECPATAQELPNDQPMKQPMVRPMERRFLCKQSASRLLTADKKQPMKRRSSIADKKRPAVSSCKAPLQANRLLFAVRSLQRAFVSRCELQRAFASTGQALAILCQLTRAP